MECDNGYWDRGRPARNERAARITPCLVEANRRASIVLPSFIKPAPQFPMASKEVITDRKILETLAPVTTAPIRLHVFVCTGKSCSAVDSAEVKAAFERELLERNLLFGKEKKGKNPKGSVLVTECASVGFCAIGAAVMVYPDGIWYAQVRAADVPELVEEHILNGRVVRRLALLQVPCAGRDELPAPTAVESANWEA